MSDAALDGRADDPGQDGRGLVEGVGRRVVLARLELTPGERPPDPSADGGEDPRHVLVARWRRGMKGEAAGLRLAEDAAKHERVVVEFELEAAPEALDHGDRPGLAVPDPVDARDARVERSEYSSIHAQHRAAQRVIPGQAVAGDTAASAPIGAARGAAFADLDGDGDLDVIVVENGGPARIFVNRLDRPRQSVRVRLVGTGKSNRDAVGARVLATTGTQTIAQQVSGGSPTSRLPKNPDLRARLRCQDRQTRDSLA